MNKQTIALYTAYEGGSYHVFPAIEGVGCAYSYYPNEAAPMSFEEWQSLVLTYAEEMGWVGVFFADVVQVAYHAKLSTESSVGSKRIGEYDVHGEEPTRYWPKPLPIPDCVCETVPYVPFPRRDRHCSQCSKIIREPGGVAWGPEDYATTGVPDKTVPGKGGLSDE